MQSVNWKKNVAAFPESIHPKSPVRAGLTIVAEAIHFELFDDESGARST